jgi:hypothetical protein
LIIENSIEGTEKEDGAGQHDPGTQLQQAGLDTAPNGGTQTAFQSLERFARHHTRTTGAYFLLCVTGATFSHIANHILPIIGVCTDTSFNGNYNVDDVE